MVTKDGTSTPQNRKLVMVNPNTSTDVTASMLSLARQALPRDVEMTALTARSGATPILDTECLRTAEKAVLALCADIQTAPQRPFQDQ